MKSIDQLLEQLHIKAQPSTMVAPSEAAAPDGIMQNHSLPTGPKKGPWQPGIRQVMAGALGLLGILSALATSFFVGREADVRIRKDVNAEITLAAERIGTRLDRGLAERLREVRLIADIGMPQGPEASRDALRGALRRVQEAHPDYALLLFVDTTGRIVATSSGALEGIDVSGRDYFTRGRDAPFLDGVNEGLLMQAVLGREEPPRFVDLAAPVRAPDGSLRGVLAAHLFWEWAEAIEAEIMAPVLARHPGAEAQLVNRRGEALLGPSSPGLSETYAAIAPQLAEGRSGSMLTSAEGRSLLVGYAPIGAQWAASDLGWSAMVRIDAERAFAGAAALQLDVLKYGIGTALTAALIGWAIAGLVARPVVRLSRAAEGLREALDTHVPVHAGPREITALGDALTRLVDTIQQHEAELWASGHRYTALIEAAFHMVWLMQLDRTLSFTSRNWQEFTGIQAEVVPVETWSALLHPEERPHVVAELEAKLAQGAAFEVRFRFRRHDGAWRWMLARGQPVTSASDATVEWIGTTVDVHELFEAQAALSTAEERLRLALDAAGLGSWDLDCETGRLAWSERHFTMLGHEPDPTGEADLALWAERVHPDDMASVTAAWTRAEKDGHPFAVTYRATRLDGRQIWLSGHGRVLDTAGGVRRFVGVVQDVTAIETARIRLADAEERLRLALEGTEEGLWDWNVQTGEVWFSDRWLGMLGYERDEIAPHVSSWERLIHPDDAASVASILQAHIEGRTTQYACEHRLRHRDGSWLWILDRGKVVARDAHGEPLRMVGTHQDIGRRKLAEDALASGEARLRSIVDTAADAILLADAEGRIATANPAAALMFGYTAAEQMVGVALEALMPSDAAARHPAYLEAHVRRNQGGAQARSLSATGRDLVACRKDGTTFPCEIAVASFNSGGERFFTGIVRDVTQRNAQEAALRDNEERFRLLVEGVAEYAIIMLDTSGNISSWNLGAERITGWREADVLGKPFSVLWPDALRAGGLPAAALEAARRDGTFRNEGERLHADGSTFVAETTVTAVLDGKGELRGFAKITRDVTARRAAQQKLAELQAKAMRASRLNAAGALAAGVAHELNQPLGAISNYASAARMALGRAQEKTDGAGDALIRAGLNMQRVADQAVRAGTIISRLRDFVGRSETQLTVIAARALLNDVAKEAQELLTSGERVRIETVVSDGTPDVFGDGEQIKLVLSNLIRNALDALQGRLDGEIRLSARPMSSANEVEFRVSDNGPGLDPIAARRVFEPFSSTKANGMGVGLAICRTIIEAHGGRIWAGGTPELGGATFHVAIPSTEMTELLGPHPCTENSPGLASMAQTPDRP